MGTPIKLILIGVVGIFLVIGLLVGVLVFLKFTPQGRTMDKRLTAMENEGTEFGKTTDQQGCVKEGLARGKKITDITSQVGNRDFVKGCLRASQASPGFCDDVPSIVGKMFTDWESKQCEKIRSPTVACQDTMKEVILFCGLKRPPPQR
ncbi:MAG TPA: hypothetical protein DC054_08120 [Blastocatellia bacterium]|nr:hypothetical protein [Blastocatellia bacterium]